jgi:predicted dehydrogenase
MGRTYRVGIIGTGSISRTHVPGWRASGLTDLAAACDIDRPVLDRWSTEFGVGRTYDRGEDLIRDPDIDIVDICTPNHYHAPLAIAALQAGKHVICEKPLAPTPAEIRRMIVARDASGRMLMTAQHFRYKGTARALRAEIAGGALGEVYHGRCWILRRFLLPVRPGFVLKSESGGGACIDIGVHILDLGLWLMGNPRPVAVSGVTRTELAKKPGAFSLWGPSVPPELDVEEFACAFVRFANGATLMLEISWMLHHNIAGEDAQVWMYGRDGGCHWPSCTLTSTNYATKQHYLRTLQLTADAAEPHAQECIEFARAVDAGAPSPVPAEQSLDVMTILDAVYRSQAEGREIRLDEPR